MTANLAPADNLADFPQQVAKQWMTIKVGNQLANHQ
jgi:hypothetical protein